MKIGICGAQSVGKTTLLNVLRSEPDLKHYAVCNEVTRRVKESGFVINERGNDLTQRQIVLEHFYNLLMHDDMMTDRTLLDSYVYTLSLFNKRKVTKETLHMADIAADRNMEMYDILFFIEPEFAVVDDGVRSTDQEWQMEINRLFISVINNSKLPVIKLTGSVVDRAVQALKVIRAKEKK